MTNVAFAAIFFGVSTTALIFPRSTDERAFDPIRPLDVKCGDAVEFEEVVVEIQDFASEKEALSAIAELGREWFKGTIPKLMISKRLLTRDEMPDSLKKSMIGRKPGLLSPVVKLDFRLMIYRIIE